MESAPEKRCDDIQGSWRGQRIRFELSRSKDTVLKIKCQAQLLHEFCPKIGQIRACKNVIGLDDRQLTKKIGATFLPGFFRGVLVC